MASFYSGKLFYREDQLELFNKFKARFVKADNSEDESEIVLTDEEKNWLTDFCLCRYLRARQWDLDASEKMLRE